MFSIHKSQSRRHGGFALALAAAAVVGGCAAAPPVREELSTEPIPVDQAMARRDWPESVAYFQGGGVEAGATRFPYAPQTTGEGAGAAVLGPERSNALFDTAMFVAQAVALPFTYFVDPPFTQRTYHGVMYENPTYTAMPVLPPEEAPTGVYDPPPVPDMEDELSAPMREDVDSQDLPPGHVPPGETPVEALPPVIEPDSSEPAPAEPGPDAPVVPDAETDGSDDVSTPDAELEPEMAEPETAEPARQDELVPDTIEPDLVAPDEPETTELEPVDDLQPVDDLAPVEEKDNAAEDPADANK